MKYPVVIARSADWEVLQASVPPEMLNYERFAVPAFPAFCVLRIRREDLWEMMKDDARFINAGRHGSRTSKRLNPEVVRLFGAPKPDADSIGDVLEDLTGISTLFDG